MRKWTILRDCQFPKGTQVKHVRGLLYRNPTYAMVRCVETKETRVVRRSDIAPTNGRLSFFLSLPLAVLALTIRRH